MSDSGPFQARIPTRPYPGTAHGRLHTPPVFPFVGIESQHARSRWFDRHGQLVNAHGHATGAAAGGASSNLADLDFVPFATQPKDRSAGPGESPATKPASE